MKLANELRRNHLKVTPQRLAIFQLITNTISHPSAEMIYSALKEQYPSMSLATVYKTLDSLKNAGLAQSLNIGEDSLRFDAAVKPHPHFICTSCKTVLDVALNSESQELLAQLRKSCAVQIESLIEKEQLFYYGTCSCCSNNGQICRG